MRRFISRLVRRCAAPLVALVLGPLGLGAQASSSEEPTQFELENLRTPTSPAFTILGIAPTAIARVSTPRALAVELLSKTEQTTVIPKDYALEVAPYWLRSRPKLSFEQYTRPTPGQSLRQSFAVSLATSHADSSAGDSAVTRVAIGLRVMPTGGRPSAKFNAMVDSLRTLQRARIPLIRRQVDATDSIEATTDSIETIRTALATARSAPDSVRRRLEPRLEAQLDTLRSVIDSLQQIVDSMETMRSSQADSLRKIAQAMGSEEAERVGQFTELAVALAASYPGEQFDGGRLSRVGVWGTWGYRLEAPRLDVIGLLRFQRDIVGEDENSLDAGGRLYWRHERLAISGEFVNRTAFDLSDLEREGGATRATLTFESSNRAVGVVEFRATDAMFVSMSFGRDHRAPATERHPLIAALGLSLQFGDKPVVPVPR
jgi:hypothetical protein